ncbi:MAG: LLM class flavin-dependent oxidoreductase [Candidatus Aenigmarchaeota archaeon]|nr:LLM class flavin-dependent oxidoreductase [Candidatus Aenigmarchaeota archaeon]
MRRIKYGLELGIRAEMEPIIRAAEIARKNNLDYFLVPETHPKMAGVNAFDALERISDRGGKTTIGTGIVSVHSRYKEDILRELNRICPPEGTSLILGMGASTDYIAKMWGFEKKYSLSKLKEYTMHLKYNLGPDQNVRIFWGVSRDKAKITAASRLAPFESVRDLNPDGVILHMETPGEAKRTAEMLRETMRESRRNYSKFEVAAIRLVYFDDWDSDWRDSARLTIANYTANNSGYIPGLKRAGFEVEVDSIRNVYSQTKNPSLKLEYASKEVTGEMLEALTTHGRPGEVAEGLRAYGKNSGVKAVIAGMDMGKKDYYRPENIKNLEELAQNLH